MNPKAESEAAIDALYANPPTEFVARRDQLVAQARADGDRPLAAQIKALRRPSVGAWYLNTAARDGLTSLRELLRLGARLREAQAGGDFAALKELAAQRGPLVSRVVRDLTAHLAQLGTTATAAGMDEVRATLASALADPEVAEQLIAGRLDRAHQYSGFGFGDGPIQSTTDDAEAEPAEPASKRTVAVEPTEPAPDPAELEAAREEVQLSQAELVSTAAAVDTAGSAAGQARKRVDQLTADLAAATAELAATESALDEAKGAHQLSVARSEEAQQRIEALTSR